LVLLLGACSGTPDPRTPASAAPEYYGTTEPFASEAVYFVVTDRFVNADESNDQREQGGEHPSFDIPLRGSDGRILVGPDGTSDNIGYLGGDFKGVLDNADYIRGMGFSAIWITPIVENPDQAFTGGDQPTRDSFLTDRGKSAYHGYWGINFYKVDEHLPSDGLEFADLTVALREKNLKLVLDIVANHGSPAYTMPVAQPQFGQLFDAEGKLLADHGNLPPARLDPKGNPLHAFYRAKPDLAQLGDFDYENPAVMDYLVGAYLQWIEQGAAAFRVDTMRHMPLSFWKRFNDRIRAEHPGFFMFGEVFEYEARKLAPYTLPQNGGTSVLDFPLKQEMAKVFGREGGDFSLLDSALYLDGGPYANPYDLMTFYDNHDMARLDATDEGFINAHNWLFTARGIPVIYYGSEVGFMRGLAEHQGNRNYFGQERVDAARAHPIQQALTRIAAVRAASPALQRGLQVNLELGGDRAAFLRIYQRAGTAQTALVLLNKGDQPASFTLSKLLQAGRWTPALGGEPIDVVDGGALRATVPAHGVQVFLLDAPIAQAALQAKLERAMAIR
jgi:cyclomaltodextrin glucanotransferase